MRSASEHGLPARKLSGARGARRTKTPPTEEKKGLFGRVVPTKPEGEEEELSESKQLMQKVKDAGVAGIISYIFWEWAFWGGASSRLLRTRRPRRAPSLSPNSAPQFRCRSASLATGR